MGKCMLDAPLNMYIIQLSFSARANVSAICECLKLGKAFFMTPIWASFVAAERMNSHWPAAMTPLPRRARPSLVLGLKGRFHPTWRVWRSTGHHWNVQIQSNPQICLICLICLIYLICLICFAFSETVKPCESKHGVLRFDDFDVFQTLRWLHTGWDVPGLLPALPSADSQTSHLPQSEWKATCDSLSSRHSWCRPDDLWNSDRTLSDQRQVLESRTTWSWIARNYCWRMHNSTIMFINNGSWIIVGQMP